MRMEINEIEQRIFIAMSGKNGIEYNMNHPKMFSRFKKNIRMEKNAEKYHECGRWIFDLVIYECPSLCVQRATIPIWSVGFEAIVFKIKTNQKGLSFFYFAILKKHVEMVWFGLFSLWNRTALLLFILIFCGLKSITKCTEKMRLGNCKRYKRFRRRAGILIKLNTQNHFFGVMKYQLPWSASKKEKNLLDEKITRHDEY